MLERTQWCSSPQGTTLLLGVSSPSDHLSAVWSCPWEMFLCPPSLWCQCSQTLPPPPPFPHAALSSALRASLGCMALSEGISVVAAYQGEARPNLTRMERGSWSCLQSVSCANNFSFLFFFPSAIRKLKAQLLKSSLQRV